MTPDQFKKDMEHLANFEASKGVKLALMEVLMATQLRSMGYHEGVEIYEKANQWYP